MQQRILTHVVAGDNHCAGGLGIVSRDFERSSVMIHRAERAIKVAGIECAAIDGQSAITPEFCFAGDSHKSTIVNIQST